MVEPSLFCIFFKPRNCNENYNLTNSQNFCGKFYFFSASASWKIHDFQKL